ncbi:SCO family protein [Sulfitobacter sp. BDSS02]|nr:SCO family protein [Sulfitobacter sp. BDSS02]MBR9848676.1 SCO family protein [Paracoccaceae bacterium]
MRRYFAFLGAAVLVAVVGGTWLYTVYARNDNPLASCGVGQVAGGSAQIGGPFELVNASGETVTDTEVITEPSLVYFGYTFCPDVCPMDMARNADAVDLLQNAGYGVTPVFITVDPDRDTPEVVGDFADNLHERMIGLTGSAEQIKNVSQTYKAYYNAHKDEGEFYLVDHSTFTYLMTPENGFIEFFRRDLSAEDMAEKTACIIDNL